MISGREEVAGSTKITNLVKRLSPGLACQDKMRTTKYCGSRDSYVKENTFGHLIFRRISVDEVCQCICIVALGINQEYDMRPAIMHCRTLCFLVCGISTS